MGLYYDKINVKTGLVAIGGLRAGQPRLPSLHQLCSISSQHELAQEHRRAKDPPAQARGQGNGACSRLTADR